MSTETEVLRKDRDALLAELRLAGADFRGDGRSMKCCFHDDGSPSAGIYLDEKDGAWKFKCHACSFGGDIFDVMAKRQNRTPADVLREMAKQSAPTPKQPAMAQETKKTTVYATLEKLKEAVAYSDHEKGGSIKGTYIYAHPETQEPELVVMRVERADKSKTFRQAHKTPEGFVMKAPAGLLPIYNRSRLLESTKVIVVEGEKCVHELHRAGIVATTSAGGAGKAHLSDWNPLAGKIVYLWPDNDPADPKTGKRTGLEHMRQVMTELEKLEPAPVVYWINPDELDLPPKGDVVDYFQKLRTGTPSELKVAVEALMEFSEPTGPARQVLDEVEAEISGRRRTINFDWKALNKATRALKPGTVTILSGPPGATKSFFLLEGLCYLFKQGVKVAIMELEETRTFHLRRALAQHAMDSRLVDDEWCANNPDDARAIYQHHVDFLNTFGRCISDFPTGDITADALLEWVETQAKAGVRVIAIDPITAMDTGDKQWVADRKFLTKARQIVRDREASLVLVTHLKKGAQGNGLDDLAGGAAYPRFAQTVMCLEYNDERTRSFNKGMTTMDDVFNRRLHISKARNAPGQGLVIAYHFNRENFCSREVGILD